MLRHPGTAKRAVPEHHAVPTRRKPQFDEARLPIDGHYD
jgi:hypothetical protein